MIRENISRYKDEKIFYTLLNTEK